MEEHTTNSSFRPLLLKNFIDKIREICDMSTCKSTKKQKQKQSKAKKQHYKNVKGEKKRTTDVIRHNWFRIYF